MKLDLQKASILKRLSAWLLDFIVLCIAVVGFASVISAVSGYDGYSESLEAHYAHYEKEYGVKFEITEEEYNAMTPEQKENYDAAYEALIANKDAMHDYNMVLSLSVLVISLGLLLGYLLTEFIIPMLLGNGQTIGKKVFALAVMRTEGVKINGISLFIRTILGKYTIETMIPVLMLIMLLFNISGLFGIILALGIGVVQIVLLISTPTNALIHDKLADTVVVDLSSQMIFDSTEALLEYKKRIAADEATKQSYF